MPAGDGVLFELSDELDIDRCSGDYRPIYSTYLNVRINHMRPFHHRFSRRV